MFWLFIVKHILIYVKNLFVRIITFKCVKNSHVLFPLMPRTLHTVDHSHTVEVNALVDFILILVPFWVTYIFSRVGQTHQIVINSVKIIIAFEWDYFQNVFIYASFIYYYIYRFSHEAILYAQDPAVVIFHWHNNSRKRVYSFYQIWHRYW